MKKYILLFSITFALFYNTHTVLAQTPTFDSTIVVNQTFITFTEIYPFNSIQMYGAGINGNVTFNSDTAIVKIILRDSLNMDYLIYETNNFLNPNTSFAFAEECEETCFFDGFTPTSIVIQVVGASVTLSNFKYCSFNINDATTLQHQARETKITEKINLINQNLQSEGYIWVAGQTSYLNKYYNEKKDLYKSCIWHPAIEYYKSGFFSLRSISNGANISVNYDYVDNFEWRNRHGANETTSYYFDGNDDGSGWVTKAACQDGCWTNDILGCSVYDWQCTGPGSEYRGAATCWAFGPTSHIEALVNLYLNYHYDIDLSEQDIVSCSGTCPNIEEGFPSTSYNYFINHGVVNEDCFPYTALETPCIEKCSAPDEKITINAFNLIPYPTQQILRESIINDGPVSAAFMNCMWGQWSHSMQLVGWDVIEWGDEDILGIPPDPAIFAQYVGCTYWIYKHNSGDRDEMHGFQYMIHENDDTPIIYIVPTDTLNFVSSTLDNFDENDIQCLDIDGDGYYNWGIGPKPATCPSCPDEPDGDDHNPGLGPLDENGFCNIIGTYNSDFEESMCNWKQVENDDCDWVKYYDTTAAYPYSGPAGTPDDSEYYIYMNASQCYLNSGAYIESSSIDLENACAIEVTFAYHKNTFTWGNDETDDSKLSLDISYDNGQTWTEDYWYVMKDQGDQWHYVTITIPSEVNKIRFYAYVGWVNYYNNIALDDITIGPAEDADITINGTTSWENPQYEICNDIIVESGASLSFNNTTINMASGSKIIVKPNAYLSVNNSNITTHEGDLWAGIEVWGDPEATQIPANQGWLSISNGGTIENAVVAVRVGSADYSDMGGGIVHTDEAILRNNRSGVIYHDYAGSNIGNFNLTTFETTAELVDSSLPDEHMRLLGVEDILINGCTFRNTRDGNTPYSQRGTGILSMDASYYVDHICISGTTPCTQYQETVFDSLNYGLKAFAISTTLAPSIENSQFTKNYRGAYLSGITQARVTSNSFYLNGTAASESYGLYLDACDQYWVENNHFEKSSTQSTQTGIGIYVSESGNQANEIYLNSFDSVEYSVIALGNNRYYRRPEIGLQIRCNDYNNTLFDEVVVYDGMLAPPTDDGIANKQGANTTNAEDMAGNLFYYNSDVVGDFDDINNQSNHFYYYYSNDAGIYNVEPLDYTTNTVTKVPKPINNWTYENGCPSGLTSGGGGSTEESRSAMADAQTDIESTEAVLTALVDGGDTETLNAEVESSIPAEAAMVYNELMAESPNLSETVVESSIEKEDVLPNTMIRDVMVANPHTSTSLQLLEKLDNRNNPMPEYMKAQILAGRSIQSLKAELEGQLAVHHIRKTKAINRIARHFAALPASTAKTDSLLALYQADNSISSSYMQAWLYLYSGQYLQGQNVMTAIPIDFSLSGDELSEYQNMQLLYTLLRELFEAGKHLDELSAVQKGQLQSLASETTGFAPVYARNVLIAIDEMEYEEPVILPDQFKSTTVEEAYKELLNSPQPKMLEVYPNPSNDFVILGYQFDTETKGSIEIRDVSGSLIQSVPFKGMQDQVSVITRSWAPGMYMVSLMVNDKVIETTKLTLIY